MGKLEVEEAIVFPFGMGAFLRHLGQNDSRYNDPQAMRKLRRRLADELMRAIVDLCLGTGGTSASGAKAGTPVVAKAGAVIAGGTSAAKAEAAPAKAGATPAKAGKTTTRSEAKNTAARRSLGPKRVHLCLVCANPESVENHNCFVEAAAESVRKSPGLTDVLRLRRNVDTLQLAHDLLSQDSGTPPLDNERLRVAILNGANRELCGNHWFEDGARFAIDENLHRRSASLARASLLLNLDTQAKTRRPKQLADNVLFFEGKVVPMKTLLAGLPGISLPGQSDAGKGDKAKGGGGGLFGCCKRRTDAPADRSSGTAKSSTKDAAKATAKAKSDKCPEGHQLKVWSSNEEGKCDGCQKHIQKNERVMDCRQCNYYLCEKCLPPPKDAAAPPGAVAPGSTDRPLVVSSR